MCQVYKKQRRSIPFRRVVAGVCLLLLGGVLLFLTPIIFREQPTSVTSGWLLLFGFIPIPIFFLSSAKFWAVILGCFGLSCILLAFKVVFER